jgi:hypothetical protein
VLVCQPPSGCRPTGELCYEDSDCCGGPGNPEHDPANVMCRKEPGFNVGRCDNGNACAPAGAICRLQDVQCNATATCCSGNAIQDGVCQQDALGIPRCGVAQCDMANDPTCGCTDPQAKVGMACASSADCCGLPCVYVPGSELGYVCGASCVMSGGECTTTADCCSGLPCNIAPGSATGTCGTTQGCADYGQSCTSLMCCNGLPCTDGVCQGIIL